MPKTWTAEDEAERFNEPITITTNRGVVHALVLAMGSAAELVQGDIVRAISNAQILGFILKAQDQEEFIKGLAAVTETLNESPAPLESV